MLDCGPFSPASRRFFPISVCHILALKSSAQRGTPIDPEDDGVPSHLGSRSANQGSRKRGKPNHHAFQLCKQARHAIDAAILCDCGDPIFDDFTACWVEPAGANLLVTFGLRNATVPRLHEAEESLSAVAVLLRMAVADAICRKKTPQLRFQIVPAAELDTES